MEELKLLNDTFDKLEGDVAFTRNAKLAVVVSFSWNEKAVQSNAQESRMETLQIVGLPKSLTNDEAETKVCQNCQSFQCQ